VSIAVALAALVVVTHGAALPVVTAYVSYNIATSIASALTTSLECYSAPVNTEGYKQCGQAGIKFGGDLVSIGFSFASLRHRHRLNHRLHKIHNSK